MLKLRSIGLSDYSVLEGSYRNGRIPPCHRTDAVPRLWSVTIHLTGGLPMGSAKTSTRPGDSRLLGSYLARTSKDELAAAYKDLNIRDDG